jgi:hypothetical protein
MEHLIVSTKTGCTTLLLVDAFVKDPYVLIDSTNATTLPILYSYLCSKTDLLAVLRAKFSTIERIGFLFTQGNANLFLDNKHFFVRENVDFILSLIQEFGVQHLDFLACETLQYPAWIHYYQELQQTGVIVGASTNKTGNIRYFSDWRMESTGEDIELVYFTTKVELYKYLLGTDPGEVKIEGEEID